MRLFGLTISRTKQVPANLASVAENPRQWWPVVREPFAGAWQRNMEQRAETVLTNPTVFRCTSLISGDIGKLRPMLVEKDTNGIWSEVEVPSFSPVLRKPNRYQNRIQFFTNWLESKLTSGNAYILKERDQRGVVVKLYVLDPNRVTPLIAPDGEVYYRLRRDNLTGLTEEEVGVPASEIIHDRWNTLFHPLVGLSPLFAAGMAALQGLRIQGTSTEFFANGSNPGGILTTEHTIDDVTAKRLKDHWDNNYTGTNVGKVAVLGDGLKYEKMASTAVESQLIDQLKWTAETICSVYGVPAYKAGVGPAPAYNNIEALDAQYYAQCLQIHIESIELCLDEGLGLTKVEGHVYGVEFDLDGLLRMDTATMVKAEAEAVKAGIKAPNESRHRLGLKPVKGGATPYLQQQNYSLAALDERDRNDPFAKVAPPAQLALPPPDDEPDADEGDDDADERDFSDWLTKGADAGHDLELA